MHLFVVNTQNFWSRSVQIWAGGLLVLRILFDPVNFFLIPEIPISAGGWRVVLLISFLMLFIFFDP